MIYNLLRVNTYAQRLNLFGPKAKFFKHIRYENYGRVSGQTRTRLKKLEWNETDLAQNHRLGTE